MLKLTYIISNINKALTFEWIFEQIKHDFNLSFIFLGATFPETGQIIREKEGVVHFIKLNGKKDYPAASVKLFILLKKLKPDIVHTNLRDADILGLSIARLLGVKKRITTRHSATFNKIYHPNSIWVDKQINRWATNIVAISENVKHVLLKEGIPETKIKLIHHGFNLKKFRDNNSSNISLLSTKYKTNGYYPVIGVISRYFELKGHRYIIDAFEKLLEMYPNAKLVLANTGGPEKMQIQEQLLKLPKRSYTEIEFESDIFSLYQLFDVFVHVPIDPEIEAFGQVYTEALAAGIPSVFTMSGVAHEFIKNKENAVVVDYKNAEQILESIKSILENAKLKDILIENGRKIVERFSLDIFIDKLKMLYAR